MQTVLVTVIIIVLIIILLLFAACWQIFWRNLRGVVTEDRLPLLPWHQVPSSRRMYGGPGRCVNEIHTFNIILNVRLNTVRSPELNVFKL